MTLAAYFVRLSGAVALSVIALFMGRPQPVAAQTIANGSLTVALTGLGNADGQVCVSLFDNSNDFLGDGDAVVAQQCVAADGSGEPISEPEAETSDPNTDADAGDAGVTNSESVSSDAEVAEEPVAEEPVAEEPVAEEPVAEESVAEESVAEEPVAEEPVQADIVITFPNLVSGTYAVAVLHDENSDQQMNEGTFGIPTEGFGFSRNPVVTTGAPEFSEVAIFVLGDTTTEIELVYF
ncbi:MAG: DUF2141 domain-containing protein [Cyanobacteria bacterium J06560_6]